MNAPLYKFGLFGDDVSLVVAFAIGLGFGFFLERAGFGSSLKLASQFYFRDMAVLKVMFSAIVTAMVGVFWLGRVGLLDVSQLYLVPTNLAPQLAGGAVLGAGFVIGGYCPGTSVVGAASGRIDALVYMAGMYVGMVTVGFLWPALGDFMTAGSLGARTLPESWGLPYGALVAALALVAVGAFLAAEWGEVKAGGRTREEQSLLWRRGPSRPRGLVAVLLLLGAGAAVAGTPYRGPAYTLRSDELTALLARGGDGMDARVLNDRLIAGVDPLRVIDLQPPEAFAALHLPGAENVALSDLPGTAWRADESVLLYAADETTAAQAWMLLKARPLPSVYTLRGGLDAWRREVAGLAAATGPGPTATPAVPSPPPAATPAPAAAPKKPKKKEGC